MSDNYQCRWCKVTDERVLEWTIWHQDWRGKVATVILRSPELPHEGNTASGDGHGIREVTT